MGHICRELAVHSSAMYTIESLICLKKSKRKYPQENRQKPSEFEKSTHKKKDNNKCSQMGGKMAHSKGKTQDVGSMSVWPLGGG